ncbi:hypothetical protein EDD11_008336 [Mortierella claussenii]|nr:hypothetical protein EDD11_008336 [Mortierella claussenii]
MNVGYSSIVKETISETSSTTHRKLVTVYKSHIEEYGTSPSLKQLFDTAREAASSEHDRDVISWLQSVIGTSGESGLQGQEGDHKHIHQHRNQPEERKVFVSPVFFPSEESFHHLIDTLNGAQKSLDICVYTITDDQVSAAIIRAHERGVKVRIISDDEKSEDQGSDVRRLARDHHIPTRVDGSPSYMHHKFAVVDDALVINGSYNWTKGARFQNREDLTLTNSGKAVQEFKGEFERLWQEFRDFEL